MEAEQLAAPHAGGECQRHDGEQRVAFELRQHVGDLLRREDLDLGLLDLGRLADLGDVAGKGAVLDGIGQDAVQELVRVGHGASSQPALDQLLVPSLQMFRLELLQTDPAEMRRRSDTRSAPRYRSSVFGDCACALSSQS